MDNKRVPFYAKTAILDPLIRSETPQTHPEIVAVIVDALKSNEELRAYFFRNQPNSAWIAILWENGFFDKTPEPEQTEQGLRFPLWDVQEYLVSVASKVPEYFLRFISKLDKNSAYAGRAIFGLLSLSTQDIEQGLPQVIEWLSDYATAQSIDYGTWDLLFRLADEGRESALTLFDALLHPFSNPHVKKSEGYTYNDEAISPFNSWHSTRDETKKAFEALKTIDSKRLTESMEANLRLALRMEEEAGDTGTKYAWWRQAIEASYQNDYHHHKDYLLDFLRDAAEMWTRENPSSAKLLIEKYLSESNLIYRRLGLHLLRVGCAAFRDIAARELLAEQNYNDSFINHEFLLLLQDGFINLADSNKQKVIDIILQGPPKDVLEHRADQWAESRGVSKEEFIDIYTKHWIRARLWMLKDNISQKASDRLKQLVAELGEPEHPTFLSWHGDGGFVSQESPLSGEQLAQYAPDELAAFMKQWQPGSSTWNGLQEISHEGLGKAVAEIAFTNIIQYRKVLLEAFSAHPNYMYALFQKVSDVAKKEALDEATWTILIGLCEDLLHIENIRTDMGRESHTGWRDVRRRIVEILRIALIAPNTENTVNLQSRIRDLLLLLLNDPDPDRSDDRPQEGWFGHKDPFAVAINHVRSDALILLIEYAILRAEKQGHEQENTESTSLALEPVVLNALNERLLDESSAVHSVYGRFLMWLRWLDRTWVEAHLDAIFPSGQTEGETWAFVSAWDSYVIANQQLDLDLMERLHPYYERAIENLRSGFVTKTHLRPVQGLASHLVFDYFVQADKGSNKPSETLLYRFLEKVGPEERADGALAVLNRCAKYANDTKTLEKLWPTVCALWQDRVHVAASQNNPPEFYKEMGWFAQLLKFAPAQETIASLWGVLQGTLPYIYVENFHSEAWDSFEGFIARQVDEEPGRSIELLTQMNERSSRNKWLTNEQEKQTRTILEKAASYAEARQQTLNFIDYLARKGDHRFRDIYERWTF